MAIFNSYVKLPEGMTFTVRHGFSMALIEIDGLPNFKKHGGSFHGKNR